MPIHRARAEPRELPRIALSLATLAAVGFSLVLSAQLLSMQGDPRGSYTLSNVLGAPLRLRLLLTLAVGMVLPVFVGLVVLWRSPAGSSAALRRLATLLSPLSIVFVVPGLFLAQVAQAKPLFYLVVLSAFGLAGRALLAASLSALREGDTPRWWRRLAARLDALHLPRAGALLLVGFAAAGYAFFLGSHAVAHHRLFRTIDSDVGIADNVMSNLLSGHLFRAPAQFGTLPGNYLTLHGDYCALVFLPIYQLHPGSETLLWLQAVLVALAVVPLFFLSARLLGQRMAIWASLSFLSLAPLHGALLFGFSWLPAFCLFFFALCYAVVADRRWLIWTMTPLLLSATEVAPLAAFALGAFLAIRLRRTQLGVGLCLLATLVFAFNTELALRGAGPHATPPLAQALVTLFSNPVYFVLDLARASKISSMLHALAPLALLPLSALPLIFPGFLFTSASREFWPDAHEAYPYALLWIPGCLCAVLFALHRLREDPSQRPWYLASVVSLTFTLFSHSFDFGALLRPDTFGGSGLAGQFQLTPATQKRYADAQSVVRRIPPTASVAATTFMLSHVSSRVDVFDVRRPYGEPDYIFFSSLELVGAARDALMTSFASRHYALTANAAEFYLFRRSPETSETSERLRQLGLQREPSAPANPPSPAPGPHPH
jgi:uncharacterized membrane protein